MSTRPRDISILTQINKALKQASDDALLYEACRRGLISTIEVKRRERQKRVSREEQEGSAARHREYVGQLFALLQQKRIEKMEEKGIWRADTVPEFAALGVMMTITIFDHLVDARHAELQRGSCNIETLLEEFVRDSGHAFAESLVSGDIRIRPTLWASLIYATVHHAAMSFLGIVDDDDEAADPDSESSPKKPSFIH